MLPYIDKKNNVPHLIVDSEPFLILGLQWACNSCFSPETMGPLFPAARELGCNTAVLPVYWQEVEPELNRYDFSLVDYRIDQARKNGLRLVLLWFASYKNAEECYAPEYIRNNIKTYRRVVKKDGSHQHACLCPTGADALERDKKAVKKLMKHLSEKESKKNTVILFQVENEPGIMGSDRCYCDECQALFKKGKYDSKYDEYAAETFTAECVARYVDSVAEAAKKAYPLPMYANVWLGGGHGSNPGENYPSGGAVPHQLDTWKKIVKNLDFIAPDIYQHGYRDFQKLCTAYGGDDNVLYIAEHSSDMTGRAERNVFYAIGEYNAIGFDPWAIDQSFPDQSHPPLVSPVDGTRGPHASGLRDSYLAIAQAMPAVTAAQGTNDLFTFVQEPGESWGTSCRTGDFDLSITYTHPEKAARGMIICLHHNEFLALGVGFRVIVKTKAPNSKQVQIANVEKGRYENQKWKPIHPIVREVAIHEPGVNLRYPGVVKLTIKKQ